MGVLIGSISQTSEFYYYRARTYSPQWGRFLQADPSGYGAGPNLYTYTLNSPLNLVDPFGLTAAGPGQSSKGPYGGSIQLASDIAIPGAAVPAAVPAIVVDTAAGAAAIGAAGTGLVACVLACPNPTASGDTISAHPNAQASAAAVNAEGGTGPPVPPLPPRNPNSSPTTGTTAYTGVPNNQPSGFPGGGPPPPDPKTGWQKFLVTIGQIARIIQNF